MNKNFKEAFEKTRIAGSIAAGALDEVSKIVKPGISTNEIDKKLVMSTLMTIKLTRLHYIIEVFQNHVVHQLIMLSVMEYPLKKS